ncbi:DUF292-domain-containing protein [Saccharata proteae CBS 121410]|uniref:DUF292-domain-containing protein n=1 Tax=Saccharata proteae CBS 121410 TaxID=1314787 RepID=A0A9P4HPS1_9PEZI|nr:DUF292-domain-containing protein [Saccharata proteae CBS 121410]
MAPNSTLISKLKVQLKLAISRLRMVQQKDTALAKQSRRSMAQLLEQGKIESARIRIENIIRSDLTTELHEILELYCELLLARSQLLDPALTSASETTTGVEPTLLEPISSLIHAAPRTSIRELHTVRTLLIERYGKELAVQAMEGTGVAPRVLSKLRTEAPRTELVDAYLREIARTYGVRVPGMDDEEGEDDDNDNDDDDASDDAPSTGLQKASVPVPTPARLSNVDPDDELSRATPPREFNGPASPLRIAPPSPSSENVAPRVRVPGAADLRVPGAADARSAPALNLKPGPKMKKVREEEGSGPGGKIPDVDELAKRFAALKR